MRRLLVAATLAATVTFAIGIASPAFADSDPTMDQIYTAAAGGHLDQAQQMISQVLADHPTSAKAHYVQAELYAKEGKTALARSSPLPSGEDGRRPGEGTNPTQDSSAVAIPALTSALLPAEEGAKTFVRIATVPIYRGDAVVRRAPALQAHPLIGMAAVGLHPQDALALGLAQGARAKVSGEGGETVLPVAVTHAVPRGAAWVESTWTQTSALPPMGAVLTVTRATT